MVDAKEGLWAARYPVEDVIVPVALDHLDRQICLPNFGHEQDLSLESDTFTS